MEEECQDRCIRHEQESLARHFESVQQIANRIHFPRMLHLLGEAILRVIYVK